MEVAALEGGLRGVDATIQIAADHRNLPVGLKCVLVGTLNSHSALAALCGAAEKSSASLESGIPLGPGLGLELELELEFEHASFAGLADHAVARWLAGQERMDPEQYLHLASVAPCAFALVFASVPAAAAELASTKLHKPRDLYANSLEVLEQQP